MVLFMSLGSGLESRTSLQFCSSELGTFRLKKIANNLVLEKHDLPVISPPLALV